MCQVKFVIGEGELVATAGAVDDGAGNLKLDPAVEELFGKVCEHTAYQPVCAAVPFHFARRMSTKEQVDFLKYHAEKKALATLLLRSAPELKMRVNIKVCADCHSFLTHAAQYLGRPIEVLEPSRKHVFRGDACKSGEGSEE